MIILNLLANKLKCRWRNGIDPSYVVIPMLYFIWFNPNKIFTVVNAVAIKVMVQCSETELNHYINANGVRYKALMIPLTQIQMKIMGIPYCKNIKHIIYIGTTEKLFVSLLYQC